MDVRYSDHLLFKYPVTITSRKENSGQIVLYSDHHSNNKSFNYWTTFDDLNTRLARFSDQTHVHGLITRLVHNLDSHFSTGGIGITDTNLVLKP